MLLIDSSTDSVLHISSDAQPDDISAEKRLAMIIASAFFIGFLGWASIMRLDAAAYAQGVVAVAGNRQAVQHREGGIITELYVKDGDLVRKGQVLLGISSSNIQAEERGLSSEYLTLLAERSRLVAERGGAATMQEPPEFAALSPADRAVADEAWQGQVALRRARQESSSAQKSVLGEQSRQAASKIGGFRAERDANREQRRLIEAQLEGMRELQARGFASKNKVRELERTAAALDGDHGAYAAQAAEARGLISQNHMQALVIDRNLIQEVDQRMREVTQRINELQPKLVATREQLSRAVVRAPAGGRVVGLSIFTVGGVVNPGQTLMEIVPQDRELVIKARLSPDDADDVRPSLATRVRFPSLHDRALPTIDGVVTSVSADSLIDEKSGVRYFDAEIHVPLAQLREISTDRPGGAAIQAGMPVEVLVPLEKRTVLQYLLEPVLKSLWRTGREH